MGFQDSRLHQPVQPQVSEHYVARLVVEKVERRVDPNVKAGKTERTIDEITTLTVKEKNLDILIQKLGLHLDIVTRFSSDEDNMAHLEDD